MTKDIKRHIIAISGGKDSAALAAYMKKKYPDMIVEYVFTDSGYELPETYEYLDQIRAVLNIDITVIKPERDFDYWLKYFKGVLPSPQNRWCTRKLKLIPYEDYIGDDDVYSYVAIRADEDRDGYVNKKGNIHPVYPFVEDGITLAGVVNILEECGLGLPAYYKWRKRSGCFFCFYQTRKEWRALKEFHPEEFCKACAYEEDHSDGRTYTWLGKIDEKHFYLRDIEELIPDVEYQKDIRLEENEDDKKLSSVFSQNRIDIDFKKLF